MNTFSSNARIEKKKTGACAQQTGFLRAPGARRPVGNGVPEPRTRFEPVLTGVIL